MSINLKKTLRFSGWLLSLLSVLVIAASALIYWRLEVSLPQLAGRFTLPGLREEVSVFRDAQGVPLIRSRARVDVARTLGYIHAQERFFQMDLFRRRAAGELSALVGAGALAVDKAARLHRFRHRAKIVVDNLPASDKALLTAYVEGVNAGLNGLGAAPYEYLFLRTQPEQWRAEDSMLAVYAMYMVLQAADGSAELGRLKARQQLPEALYEWLSAPGTDWDAALAGDILSTPALPTAAELGKFQALFPDSSASAGTDDFPGSNNWAVAGSHTETGAAMLANDMHLSLSVPNNWFRAQLSFNDGERDVRVTGVTLPGAPLIVVGSNEQIAWGFTNSYIDSSDVIALQQSDAEHYQSPDGIKPLQQLTEMIEVKGKAPVALRIAQTEWGPVVHQDAKGQRYVFRWLAHDADAINLDLLRLEAAQDVMEAVKIAHQIRIPAQNFVVADRLGSIAWTIAGAIPKRIGFDGQLPGDWQDGSKRWDGNLNADEYPVMLNPLDGRIWTANNRVVGGEALKVLGSGGYDLGARAKQIRDGLLAKEQFSERDLLAIQLDDRALLLMPWREHLLELLDADATANQAARARFRAAISQWDGHANVDSIAYGLVREFRFALRDDLMQAWLAPLYENGEEFKISWLSNQWEGNLWQVLKQQPSQLLPKPFKSWTELELAVLDRMLIKQTQQNKKWDTVSWGLRNRAQIQHPLSTFIPLIGKLIDAPADLLAGDSNMPRVAGPKFGASERMVVVPGHEDKGIFHMPTSQSGHPMSPYYMIGHEAWVNGDATPFLPGEAVYKLYLQPQVPVP